MTYVPIIMRRKFKFLIFTAFTLLLFFSTLTNAVPYRNVRLVVTFPNFILKNLQTFQLDVNVKNDGTIDEYLDLTVREQKGWGTSLNNGKYDIRSVYVER